MKFSIIVPVYNSEPYLKECINSVLVQSYSNFELILIDDGSTDNSSVICDEYARIDSRIIVIHQVNSGVSSARNKGLDVMSGDWLLFLDSDDTLHPYILERLRSKLVTTPNVDILQFEYTREPLKVGCMLKGKEILPVSPQIYSAMGMYNVCAAGSLIKIKLVQEHMLRFDTRLKLAEDQVFIFQVIHNSEFCSKVPDVLYFYRNNPTSATQNPKLEYMLQTIEILQFYKKQLPLSVEQFDNVILSFIYNILLNKDNSVPMIIALFDKVNIKYVRRCSRGVRFMYYLSRISRRLSIKVIRILKMLL